MPFISLLLVSKRPRFLPVILDLIAAQSYRNFETIVVLHGYGIADLDLIGRNALQAAAQVESAPSDWSLGRCLNHAIHHSKGALCAKIDDDDLYGKDYLAEAVEAYRQGYGDIIGKCETYVYLAASRSMLLRNPCRGLERQTVLGGGSLVFPRHFGEAPGFRDISLGEDQEFVADCLALGARPYATSRRNMIVRRFAAGHDHTAILTNEAVMATGPIIRTDISDDSPQGLLRLIGGSV